MSAICDAAGHIVPARAVTLAHSDTVASTQQAAAGRADAVSLTETSPASGGAILPIAGDSDAVNGAGGGAN